MKYKIQNTKYNTAVRIYLIPQPQKAKRTVLKKKKDGTTEVKEIKGYKLYNKDIRLYRKEEKLLRRFPDPMKPKRAPSAFNLYAKDWSDENEDLIKQNKWKIADVYKEASIDYKKLDELRKLEYKRKQEKLSQAYKGYKKYYKENEVKRLMEWILEAKKLKDSRPPRSGYSLYVSMNSNRFEKGTSKGNGQIVKV